MRQTSKNTSRAKRNRFRAHSKLFQKTAHRVSEIRHQIRNTKMPMELDRLRRKLVNVVTKMHRALVKEVKSG
jgi:hypothetical protein